MPDFTFSNGGGGRAVVVVLRQTRLFVGKWRPPLKGSGPMNVAYFCPRVSNGAITAQ